MIISEEQVRQRSYEIWEREGRPTGTDKKHWAQAWTELQAEFSCDTSFTQVVPARPSISRRPRRVEAATCIHETKVIQTDLAHDLQTKLVKCRWLGLEQEAERLNAELARLHIEGPAVCQPRDTD